ncbi:Charged multivesicular body 3 [Brachionus plicatilis]|uniref:Charged multivesicular body 3 n=1 Tax=Brachionus plicatilis TaxID=10195 RepID=A0A3M7RSP8_BRAPC|nr:Charged multivesicular body 3 [Brachionus plicatilis]
MGLFGSDVPPYEKAKEKVNQISSKLRSESRILDRQIRQIEREEQKTIIMIKNAAKKNQIDVCKIAAKSLVHSKKQKARIYASKAQMNSVIMQMKNQLGQMKIAGAMKSSTEVMKAMSNLMKLPEMQKTMQEMSKEMMKMGIIDELINETVDSVLDDDDIDRVADEEVDKIILEITQGKLKDAPDVQKSLPVHEAVADVSDDDLEEQDEISKRLDALRS